VTRPVLLDLYCGLGGAAMGYHQAGFDVIGVDIKPQPDYPFEFHQGDALEVLRSGDIAPAVAVHASPPCQASSNATKGNRRRAGWTDTHVDLIPETRRLLDALGLPYVIENVQGSQLRRDLTLCGEMFGLAQIRHRYFELGGWSMTCPPHVKHRGYVRGWRHGIYRDGPYLAVYGDGGGKATTEECRVAQGIDWSFDRKQLVEAIPPAYTELIGARLFAHVTAERAA